MLANVLKTSIAVVMAVLYVTASILVAPIIIPLGAVMCYTMEGNLDGITQLMKEMYGECMVWVVTLKLREEI